MPSQEAQYKMRLYPFILAITSILQILAVPLQQNSIVSLRTTQSQPSAGGNTILYKPLILEEWSSDMPANLLQSWTPNCTLPDIDNALMAEGLLRPSYPLGDGVWFLCRDVPVNSSFTGTRIAPLMMINLQESGNLITYATDPNAYPGGTTTNLVLPYENPVNGLNSFYILAGGSPASPGTPARPAQPRIRVDTGQGTPPEVQGPLATLPQGANPIGLTIMTDTLYMPTQIPNGTSTSILNIYQVGTENILPTGARNTITPILPNHPLMLSSWTFPFVDILWFTGFNVLPYLARTNYEEPDPTKQTSIFTQFPGSSASGTLGGARWRVNSARFEANYLQTGETVYISNQTTVMKNSFAGLLLNQPYEYVLQIPPEWKIMDVHVRQVFLPSPSPTPTATSTPTATVSASATSTSTSSPSATSSASNSATSSPSATSTATSSMTSTYSSQPTQSSSPSSSASASATASPSSNATGPFVPANSGTSDKVLTPAESTGIGLGVIAFVAAAGLLAVIKIPFLKNLYTRQFGSRAPKPPQTRRIISKKDHTSIEINQNPYHASMARIAQLKAMQDFNVTKHAKMERTKKLFAPSQTPGASV